VWIVRLALRRPYSVITFCLVMVILGALALRRMRVDILPAIDIPVVIVVWNYPGLSAEDMEQRVIYITERALSTTVDGIARLESSSIEGVGIVRAYFQPGSDIGGAIAQIASVTSTILRVLPPGMTPPAVLRFNASNVPVAQLTLSGASEQALYDYGLNFLRLRLFTIPGLSTPAPYGGRTRQIMVDIDPAKLAAAGLSPQDVVDSIQAQNVILPAGTARIAETEYDVALNGSPSTVVEFNQIPVREVNGRPILLGDIAHVYDGYAEQTNIVRVNNLRATYLAILKKATASTLTVVDSIKEMLPRLQDSAPSGVKMRLDFDQSVFVRAAVMRVLSEAVIAAVLVSLMVLFFLGSWRATLVVSTSIPIAIICGVVGLFLSGQTLNLMTLGGLALAIGMLVDDATVEIENIERNQGMGKGLTKAILDGAHQVAVPALAATLTICIVFFPVVLLEGPAQYLFVPLALAVVFSMLASYLLSRTLVPAMARKLLRGEAHAAGPPGPPPRSGRAARFNAWRDRAFGRLRDAYGALLAMVLAHRARVLAAAGLLFASALALLPVVGLDFFPRVDAGQMRLHVRAPVGLRIEETERRIAAVEDLIREVIPSSELETINDDIGIPAFYNLGFISTDNVGGQDADVLVALKPRHRPTARYQQQLRTRLGERFPDTQFYFQAADVVSQVLNFGLAAPIDIQILGRDPNAALAVARTLVDGVRQIPGTEDVRIAQVTNHPALKVDVDRQRALALGITERDVANSLLTSLSSSSLIAPSFWVNPHSGVNYVVAVQTPIDRVSTVAALRTTPVSPSAAGSLAPPVPTSNGSGSFQAPYLTSVASVVTSRDRSSISHLTVQPTIDVLCDVQGRDLGAVAGDIARVVHETKLPGGLEVQVRGQSDSMFTAFRRLGLGMIVAIALVYLLLVTLYQSWVDPLVIIVAIPGAGVGILWMLALTGTTLNVESFMGSIMSVGIATSNSILLVSFANDRRAADDRDPVRAALDAGRTRLRPVLMTALAMILGMLPMALGLGEGGEQNAPLGRAVIGGLLVATVTTLFIVPVAYTLLRRAPPKKAQLDVVLEKEEREGEAPPGEPAHA
jgi:multidrug efflux pump subunit AcrB